MVFSGTMCSQLDIEYKAGPNVSTGITELIYNSFIEQAEGKINAMSRYDWVTNWASLTSEFRDILRDTASSMASVQAISYDMSGYTSRGEAESMITIQRDNYLTNIQMLRDMKVQKEINKNVA